MISYYFVIVRLPSSFEKCAKRSLLPTIVVSQNNNKGRLQLSLMIVNEGVFPQILPLYYSWGSDYMLNSCEQCICVITVQICVISANLCYQCKFVLSVQICIISANLCYHVLSGKTFMGKISMAAKARRTRRKTKLVS